MFLSVALHWTERKTDLGAPACRSQCLAFANMGYWERKLKRGSANGLMVCKVITIYLVIGMCILVVGKSPLVVEGARQSLTCPTD